MSWLAPLTAESHLEARLRIIRRLGWRTVTQLEGHNGRPYTDLPPDTIYRLREMMAAGWPMRRMRDALHIGDHRLRRILELLR